MRGLDINQEAYFPPNFKIFGGMLIIGAFIVFGIADVISLTRALAILLLFSLGAMMLSMRYGLKINVTDKTYTVYTLFFGFKIGKAEPFQYIEKFYINQIIEKSLLNTRTGAKFDVRKKIYKAYIRFDNGEKIHLDTDKSETKLMRRVDSYKRTVSSIYRPEEE